jgi:transposase
VPDHSTFSKNRHGRFRESDLLQRLFETVLQRCIDEGLVGGEGFAVDASLIHADAGDRNRIEGAAGLPPKPPAVRSRNISPCSTMRRSARQVR